ncbi:MAG: 30S ribosomal protein S8 [Candidatus Curtissbacteria bacterium]|nr:30S ribosomal protein S8 [Candidatus Curtissbacteria bacterium]
MDPIADMLVAIKNGYMARKQTVSMPHSKFKFEIAKVLEKSKFIASVQKTDTKLEVGLLYENNKPKLKEVKKVSKLGLRVYTKSKDIKSIKGGRGITIVSTPQGVMTGSDARSKKLGGEVICIVW